MCNVQNHLGLKPASWTLFPALAVAQSGGVKVTVLALGHTPVFSMIHFLTWPHNGFDLPSISPVNNFYTGEHFRPLTCEPGHAGEQTRLSQGQQPLRERGGGDDHLKGRKKKEKPTIKQNKITFRNFDREGK